MTMLLHSLDGESAVRLQDEEFSSAGLLNLNSIYSGSPTVTGLPDWRAPDGHASDGGD
jgi:hypothetical protein